MSGQLQYRYVPRLKPALRGLAYCLGFCAFSVWHAANDLHGLRFAGLIRLSPSATTRLFVALALVSGLVIFFGISSVVAHVRPPRYLQLHQDLLAIPVGSLREFRNVPYRSIHDIRLVGTREQSKLQIMTADGEVTVRAFMLDSDDRLLEVETALRSRVRDLQDKPG